MVGYEFLISHETLQANHMIRSGPVRLKMRWGRMRRDLDENLGGRVGFQFHLHLFSCGNVLSASAFVRNSCHGLRKCVGRVGKEGHISALFANFILHLG